MFVHYSHEPNLTTVFTKKTQFGSYFTMKHNTIIINNRRLVKCYNFSFLIFRGIKQIKPS